MSNTKIKAGQFAGIVGHGTDGYFLMTNGDGTMAWAQASTGPSVTSVAYSGDDTAADPAGGQTIVLTGTGFAASGMTVTIGGTTAPSVAHTSNTQLTITTPAKAAGDYDIVVTNGFTGASGTFVNGISYNGVPTWTTAAGSLGTFESETTISTITLQATEPDGGTITFNITNGALPTGLSLTGANIDGTTTAESSTTLYSFTIEAIDDENQSTPRNFSITVNSAAIVSSENFTINTYTGNGSTQAIEGKIGTAASFNSSKLTNMPPIAANSNYSVSLWFKTSSASRQSILASNSSTHTIALNIFNGQLAIHETDVGDSDTFSGTWNDGNWHHLVMINKSAIWVDGVNRGTTTQDLFENEKLEFGYWEHTGPSYYFNGLLDQVRIFNKALSSSEVTTLYGENNTSTTKSTTDIFADGSGVALYEFEKGAIDTGGTNGYIGSGGVFSTNSTYVSLPSNFNLANNSFTISAWFANTKSSGNSYGITSSGSGTSCHTNLHIGRRGSNGKFAFAFFCSDLDSSTNMSTDGTWQHWVCTYDASTNSRKIYLNGTLDASDTAGNDYIGTANLQLGGDTYWGAGNEYQGKLDQVRIFNKALSSSEVTTLYGETSASATKSTTDIFDDGSGVALYELDGDSLSSNFEQAASFNGSSSYISLANADSILGNPAGQSISVWANFNSVTTSGFNSTALLASNNGVGAADWQITLYDGKIYADYFDGAGAYRQRVGSTVLSANTWYHFVIIFDSTNSNIIQCYVNGSAETMTNQTSGGTFSGNINNSNIPITIGRRDLAGGSWYMNGSIDQVRIFNTALGQADVTKLYKESSTIPTANLVAHYKLDGDATDETGNYHGTPTSITYSTGVYGGIATNVSYAYDGTPTNVGFVGTAFQPDFVWVKLRDASAYNGGIEHHVLTDSVRGVNSQIFSNLTNAQGTFTNQVTSLDSNGFSIQGFPSSDPEYGRLVNEANKKYVAWTWKAGGTAVSNTDGSITSTVSANQDAGFSIVKYTGNGLSSQNVGHGLSSAPEFIIIKNTTTAQNWLVYNTVTNLGDSSLDYGYLSLNYAFNHFGNSGLSYPTSTVFNVGTSSFDNSINDVFIAYCFRSVPGYQKVGTYTGTGVTGNSIVTGFRPRFIIAKRTNAADNWRMYDSVRNGAVLYPNLSADEDLPGHLSFDSNGFTWLTDNNNGSGSSYIYLAIA